MLKRDTITHDSESEPNYEYGKNTYLIDIDGTILTHHGAGFTYRDLQQQTPTPGTIEKLQKWFDEGHHIIITTARPESTRHFTEKQLEEHGVKYHRLIMDLTSGVRILINDKK